jgi:hypothetical protein
MSQCDYEVARTGSRTRPKGKTVYDEDAVLAAVSRCDFEVARTVAARLLGITEHEAVMTGHSMEVSRVLQRMIADGRVERVYARNGRCAFRRPVMQEAA